MKQLIFLVIFLIMAIPNTLAVAIDNPNIPIVKPDDLDFDPNITINVSVDSANFWDTDDHGKLGSVSDIYHNWLSGLEGGGLSGYYHLNSTVFDFLMDNIFDFITTTYYDQNLNTTERVVFQTVNLTCGPHFNQSCLNVSGDINVRDVYARDGYFANSTIYIGEQISLSASGATGSILNVSGGNVSSAYYFGSGQFLTDLNLTNISFEGDTINATTFNGDEFVGGNFYGVYDWTSENPWLIFNGTYLEFNETELQEQTEVTLVEETTLITVSGGTGTNQTINSIDFNIKQINVSCSSGTTFRFEAVEDGNGNIIDKDRKQHTTDWAIAKDYPINDYVNFTISNTNPTSDTCLVTIKYLDNFN